MECVTEDMREKELNADPIGNIKMHASIIRRPQIIWNQSRMMMLGYLEQNIVITKLNIIISWLLLKTIRKS